MNSQSHETYTSAHLANLSPEKLQPLEIVLALILASSNAQDIYAQLIDGKPTWQSYPDPNFDRFPDEVMIVSDHPCPSDEAIQLYEEVRTTISTSELMVDIKVSLLMDPIHKSVDLTQT